MSYRIEYPGLPVVWNPDKLRWRRILGYGCVCFACLTVLVCLFWQEGREVLQEWIYPGDMAVTRKALIQMASNLKSGAEIEEAVLVFCREVLAGA